MNKKVKGYKKVKGAMVVGAVAGVLTIGTSVLASTNNGYQLYKETMLNTLQNYEQKDNYTVSTEFNLKDGEEQLIALEGTTKVEDKKGSQYILANILGKENEYIISHDENQTISKYDGKYTVYNEEDREYEIRYTKYVEDGEEVVENEVYFKNDEEMHPMVDPETSRRIAELLMDSTVGDLKNQFIVKGEYVELNLEKSQIPELAQILFDVAVQNRDIVGKDERNMIGNQDQSIFEQLGLDKCDCHFVEADIERATYSAKIEDGIATEHQMECVITGKDDEGQEHTVTLALQLQLQDIGSTVADEIDLSQVNPDDIEYLDEFPEEFKVEEKVEQ